VIGVPILVAIVAAVLAALVGVVANLYSDALGARYPHAVELLRRKPIVAGAAFVLVVAAASLPSVVQSPSSDSTSGAREGAAPASPSGAATSGVPPRPLPVVPTVTATGAGPSPAVPRVRYAGTATIITDAKDFDHVPPTKAADDVSGDFDYNLVNGKIYASGDASLAVWDGKRQPSYSDCTDLATAASRTSLELKIGDTVCALTGEGRTVRMKVSKYCDGYCAIVDTLVWELP
jgi:hypothetical protein